MSQCWSTFCISRCSSHGYLALLTLAIMSLIGSVTHVFKGDFAHGIRHAGAGGGGTDGGTARRLAVAAVSGQHSYPYPGRGATPLRPPVSHAGSASVERWRGVPHGVVLLILAELLLAIFGHALSRLPRAHTHLISGSTPHARSQRHVPRLSFVLKSALSCAHTL